MISQELMQKVRQLEILTSRAVNDVFAGEYSSAFKGRGMEFSEVREYQPGDDVRTIDWNVTARSNTPFVKRYVEERELTIIFAVDLSASGTFGSVDRVKNETAAELCAVLAFAANKTNDKVGLLVFTDEIELYTPPKKGSNHVLRIIRDVLDFSPARGGTDTTAALEHLARVLKRRAVIFLISDFLDPALPIHDPAQRPGAPDAPRSAFETAIRPLARRHDLVAIRIADPRESELPRAGLLELHDPETGERLMLDTGSKRIRNEYARLARRRADSLTHLFRRLSIDHITITTHEPYLQTLINLFRRRERRR